ncbi:hypothetical protein GC093_33460 [Paenibacillus sp. LMG 31456]|uniref:Uncharacterized protein n=1 Tax=Paenibacillus foliorum TaxID=2654974 RepID=A0A972H1H2_9BACL|nr:hypothetical protein [Paenibacillus foliorum]
MRSDHSVPLIQRLLPIAAALVLSLEVAAQYTRSQFYDNPSTEMIAAACYISSRQENTAVPATLYSEDYGRRSQLGLTLLNKLT